MSHSIYGMSAGSNIEIQKFLYHINRVMVSIGLKNLFIHTQSYTPTHFSLDNF